MHFVKDPVIPWNLIKRWFCVGQIGPCNDIDGRWRSFIKSPIKITIKMNINIKIFGEPNRTMQWHWWTINEFHRNPQNTFTQPPLSGWNESKKISWPNFFFFALFPPLFHLSWVNGLLSCFTVQSGVKGATEIDLGEEQLFSFFPPLFWLGLESMKQCLVSVCNQG